MGGREVAEGLDRREGQGEAGRERGVVGVGAGRGGEEGEDTGVRGLLGAGRRGQGLPDAFGEQVPAGVAGRQRQRGDLASGGGEGAEHGPHPGVLGLRYEDEPGAPVGAGTGGVRVRAPGHPVPPRVDRGFPVLAVAPGGEQGQRLLEGGTRTVVRDGERPGERFEVLPLDGVPEPGVDGAAGRGARGVGRA